MPRPILLTLFAWFLLSSIVTASDTTTTVYELAQVEGVKVGSRVIVTKTDAKSRRTVATLELTLKRYGSVVRLRREEGDVETMEGKLIAIAMQQGVPGGKMLSIRGSLEDGKMMVQVDERPRRPLLWKDEVIGLYSQDTKWATRKPKPGDTFRFHRYEATYNTLLNVLVSVKATETVDVLGVKRDLLRIEMTPDKLEAPGIKISPPTTVVWLDGDFQVVRRQTELDGLGTLTLTRTTKEKLAVAVGGVGNSPGLDIGARSLIPLDRLISRPYDTRKVTYRLTAKGEPDAASLFVHDSHQRAANEKGESFELTVAPTLPGKAGESQEIIADEFLASSHYIDAEDDAIVTLARKAIAGERDPWKKACRIERWVKNAMRNDNSAAISPASQVARSLRGDCRHHAFLTAALCRAVNIPARTAIGLLYVNRGGPKLGFHTWVEVHVEGKWVGIDSTLGKGGVSATHIKVTHHSWHATDSMTPLVPVNRVIGKLRVEILRAD